MDFITAKGLIVRETDFNEADKMLTILTDTCGLITVKAAGIKSFKRKDLSGAKPFIYGHYILTQNGEHYTLRECNIVNQFLDIKNDIKSLALGFYILEVGGNAAMENEPDVTLLRLILNSLFALNKNKIDKTLLKAAFEMKLTDIIGYTPHTFECMECCDLVEDEFCYFDLLNGGILCKNCCQDITKNIIKTSAPTLDAINYILDSDIKSFLAFDLKGTYLTEFSQICEKFLMIHSGFTPKTLNYLKSL